MHLYGKSLIYMYAYQYHQTKVRVHETDKSYVSREAGKFCQKIFVIYSDYLYVRTELEDMWFSVWDEWKVGAWQKTGCQNDACVLVGKTTLQGDHLFNEN